MESSKIYAEVLKAYGGEEVDTDLTYEQFVTLLRSEQAGLAIADEGLFEASRRIMNNCVRLGSEYKHEKVSADILVFASTVFDDLPESSNPARAPLTRAAWDQYTSGDITFHTVESTHARMLQPQALAQFGPTLDDELRAAYASSTSKSTQSTHEGK
jgi:thioesterase domain-containing protein